MVIDSVSNGFALHEVNTGKYLYNFATPPRARTLPRQVAFGEDGKVIVGGSDNGIIAIYDRKTAALLETFKPTKGLLQTVHVSKWFHRNKLIRSTNRRLTRLTKQALSSQHQAPSNLIILFGFGLARVSERTRAARE